MPKRTFLTVSRMVWQKFKDHLKTGPVKRVIPAGAKRTGGYVGTGRQCLARPGEAFLRSLKKTRVFWITLYLLVIYLIVPGNAYAMHIMEGFLPLPWCGLWYALALPFVAAGLWSIGQTVKANPRLKMLLGLAGAFTFVLSALKLPSVTGSCSHPTGVGLGAILFGPTAMSVLGCIVLIFQALLLAHGGISTLGANTFSMAVVGPFVAYGIYRAGQRLKAPLWLSVLLASALGDLMTYVTTSLQLALAFPADPGGVAASFLKFMGIFAVTQIPLAISEGLLTIVIFNFLVNYNKQELQELKVLSREVRV